MAEQYSFGTIETANGQGPAGDEIPYYRVISSTLNLYWPSVGLGTPQSINLANYGYLVQGSTTGLDWFTVSSANPSAGTYHLRAPDRGVSSGGATTFLAIGDQLVSTTSSFMPPVGFAIVENNEYTFSFDLARTNIVDQPSEEISVFVRTYNPSTGAVGFPFTPSFFPSAGEGVYESYSYNWTWTPGSYQAGHTLFTVTVGWSSSVGLPTPPTIDIDNISLDLATTPTVLYWTNAGFRFPYPRWD